MTKENYRNYAVNTFCRKSVDINANDVQEELHNMSVMLPNSMIPLDV